MLLARRFWRSRHGNAIQKVRTAASAPASALVPVPVPGKATATHRVTTRWFYSSRVARSVDANDTESETSLRVQHQSAAPTPTPTASTSTAVSADVQAEAEAEEESRARARARTPTSDRTPRSRTQLDTLARPSSHSSLRSFQAYARRTGLSPMSTVYAGTSYEYVTQATLRDYGFELYRVGGRGDRGVDLIGIWRVPGSSAGKRQAMGKEKEQENDISPQQLGSESSSRGPPRYETPAFAFKVLVQCKRLVGKHAKIGPHLIRELDGTVRAARITPLFDAVFPHNGPNTDTYTASAREKQNESPEADADADADGDIDTHIVPYKTPEHQHHSPSHGASHLAAAAAGGTGTAGPTIGVLVSTKPATKGVVDSMRRSSRGLVWIMMEQVRATPEIGLEGGDPTLCRSKTQSAEQQEDDSSSSEPESEAPSPPSPPDFSSRGRVKQILWNQAARDLGLEGVDVVKRYDGEGDEEVVLMRGGRVWCPS